MTLPAQRAKYRRVSDTPAIQVSLSQERRQRCLPCLFGPAATQDVRISVTVLSTSATWQPSSMTGRGAMTHSVSTIQPDGARCGGSCWSATYCVSRAAMLVQKQTTSYRHAKAARCGHSRTYKDSVTVVTRERRGETTAPEGMPVILPIIAAAEIRRRDA
jgi:hypothetical protein